MLRFDDKVVVTGASSGIGKAAATVKAFGGIDVWVNNAGKVAPPKELKDVTDQERADMLAVDLDGCFFECRVIVNQMNKQGYGLGLRYHEPVPLPPPGVKGGMLHSVEPGAYAPRWGGIRVEEDIVVTATGAEVLGPAAKELTSL